MVMNASREPRATFESPVIELGQVMTEIEKYREQVGYYPTSGEWNTYAQAEGLLTSADIWVRFKKKWFELIPEAQIEKTKRLSENRLKSPLVLETELGILAFVDEHSRFPDAQEWNKIAVAGGLLTTAELQKQAMNWWQLWSERYGGIPAQAPAPQPAPAQRRGEQAAVREPGRAGRPRNPDPTLEDCVLALQKAAEKLGNSFLQKDYNEYAKESGLPPFNKFAVLFKHQPKQWDAAMQAAGLAAERPNRDRVTRDDAIAALQEAAKSLGDSFTQQEYKAFASEHGLPQTMTIVKLYGEEDSPWAAAMLSAGLKSKRERKEQSA